jgi:hypothetical protein
VRAQTICIQAERVAADKTNYWRRRRLLRARSERPGDSRAADERDEPASM